MALNFDPSPYLQVWQQRRQEQQQQPSFSQTILEGLKLIGDQSRQRQLMDLQKQKLVQDQGQQQMENDYKYGKAIDPNIDIANPTGQMGASRLFGNKPMSVAGNMPLVDAYNKFRAGGMKPAEARPEFMGAMGQDERKQFFENANPKPVASYVIPQMDASGAVSGFTPLPAGTKPAMAAKPMANTMRAPNALLVKTKAELGGTKAFVRDTIAEIDRIEQLNENSRGGVLGGAIQKTSSMLNIGTDSPEFTNTADVINTMQAQVARVLKSTFGGQLSDGERAYLNEVYGALPTLSPQERKIAMQNVKTMLKSKLSESESKFSELSGFLGGEPGSDQQAGQPNVFQSQQSGNKIRVRNIRTGQTGTVSEQYFDPNKYERI